MALGAVNGRQKKGTFAEVFCVLKGEVALGDVNGRRESAVLGNFVC